VYGVFAGAVIGMFGTYLAVYVVLLGAVLNAQLALLSGRSVGGLGASGGDPSKRPDEPAQAN
jgi:uncharacterized BrkB/YihY/UPF0761 family membrane protein